MNDHRSRVNGTKKNTHNLLGSGSVMETPRCKLPTLSKTKRYKMKGNEYKIENIIQQRVSRSIGVRD